MSHNREQVPVKGTLVVLFVLINAVILRSGFVVHNKWYWLLALTVPLLLRVVILWRREKSCSREWRPGRRRYSVARNR
jgi:hypothetical protein